jgi:pimeloyl-ACP methyl ester carboxylesterase
MAMRCQGQALDLETPIQLPGATGKVLLLIHGLCMNDLQWSVPLASGGEHNHGAALAGALGYTPVYLRYNTGLPIFENGRALSGQIAQLLRHWPVPVTDLSIVGHSMGGLVTRSALHHAQQDGADWPAQVRHVVFLGTPHLGAPLEKAGHWVDVMLGSTPYSRPLAQLGKVRSVGITDLRHGRIAGSADPTPLALPAHIASYAVAATLAGQRSLLADRLLGDGLVPLPSALAHGTAGHRIVHKTGHIELLGSPQVAQQLIDWMR